MNKNNEKQKDTEKSSTKPSEKKANTARQSFAVKFRPYLGGLSLILALIACVGVIYLAYQLSSMDRGINQEMELSNNTIANLVEQQKKLLSQLNNNEKILQQNQQAYEKQFRQLENQFDQKLKEQGYQKEDWQLLKARYFLEMAQINAHWQQDPSVTVAMLQQADQLLKSFNSSDIYTIRQEIAKDINTLQTLKTPDRVGLLSQLDALRHQVQALTTDKPAIPVSTKDDTPASSEKNAAKNWKERWANSVNLLEKLVVIRYHHTNTSSVITPAHQEIVKESINLSLQQAQWAIMQNNQQIFQYALKESIQQLQQLSVQNKKSVQNILSQLKKLAQTSISFTYPVPKAALEQLNALIKNELPKVPTAVNNTPEETAQ